MSSIPGKNTRIEVFVRGLLYARGYRYRLHYKGLPGRPDIVFPKHRAAVFVNGCFWHGHSCHIYNPKRKLTPQWEKKIQGNAKRDQANQAKLDKLGWKSLVIWECAIQGKEKLTPAELFRTIEAWLFYDPMSAEIQGRKKPSP